jgi:hypothetical protein
MASRDRRQSGLSLTVIMLANERRLLALFGHAAMPALSLLWKA